MSKPTPPTPATPAAAPAVKAAVTATPAKPTVDPTKTSGAVRVQGAPFRIQPIQKRDNWLKMLVYGAHGTGKTELAGSSVDVPEMRDVLCISVEKGTLTLSETPRIANSPLIDVVDVTEFKTVSSIHDFLVAHCKFRDANDEEKLKTLQKNVLGEDSLDRVRKYKTVIVDSLTETEVLCTYQILSIDSQKIIPDADIDIAGWPEFRKNFEMTKLLVRTFRDLPMNVIFICGQQYTQDERKTFHYTPQLTGKLSDQVQGFVDIVGWLHIAQGNDKTINPRRMMIQPMVAPGLAKYDAKNRKAAYAKPYFDDPTMPMIMSATGMSKNPS